MTAHPTYSGCGLQPDRHDLIQLINLDLRNNRLLSLSKEIAGAISLRNLSLDRNRLTKLPVELGQLPDLESITIKWNPLEDPPPEIIEEGPEAILDYLRKKSEGPDSDGSFEGQEFEDPDNQQEKLEETQTPQPQTEKPERLAEEEDSASPLTVHDDTSYYHDAAAEEPKLGFTGIARCMVDLIEFILNERKSSDPIDNGAVGGTSKHRRSARGSKINQSEPAVPLVTFGLFGPWGAGKSSLINALKREFRWRSEDNSSPHGYLVVPINPWKWVGNVPVQTFLHDAVISAVAERLERWQRLRLKTFLWFRMHGTIVWSILGVGGVSLIAYGALGTFAAGAGTVGGGTLLTLSAIAGLALKHLGGPLITDLLTKIVTGMGVTSSGVTELDATLNRLAIILADAQKGDRHFVFILDDLDRCAPDRVADFLNAIHSLTSAGGVVFIACDEEFVAAALNAHYGNIVDRHPDGRAFGRRFLEKIVQVPYRVPAIDESGLIELGLLADSNAPTHITRKSAIEANLEHGSSPHGDNAQSSTSETSNTPQENSTERTEPPGVEDAELRRRTREEEEAERALLSGVMARLLRGKITELHLNVRQIKSLYNTLKLHRSIDERGRKGILDDDSRIYAFAAFLLAEFVDREWLDAVVAEIRRAVRRSGTVTIEVLEQITENQIANDSPVGPLFRQISTASEILTAIGQDIDRIKEFYRIIGRPAPI